MGKCESVILEYLKEQNRPFNCNELEAHLRPIHKVSKNEINEALVSLVGEGLVQEKPNGKSKIFWPTQSAESSLSREQMYALKSEIASFRRDVDQLTKDIKEMENLIAKKSSTPSGAFLRKQIKELNDTIVEKETKLQKLKDDGKKVDPDGLKTAKRKRDIWVDEWRKRKRLSNGIFEMLLENWPKKKSDLIDSIGSYETDEDAGVSIPKDK